MSDIPAALVLPAAIPVVVGAFALLETLIQRPVLAAWLVLVTAVIDEALGQYAEFPVGPFNASPSDVVVLLLTVAATARFLRRRTFSIGQRLLIALLVLLVLSMVRGIMAFGPSAVTEFRLFLKFFGPALYFASVTPDEALLEKVGRWWIGAALAFTALVSLRWAAAFTDVNLGPLDPVHTSARYVLKAIPGPTSFVIGQALIIALAAAAMRGRTSHYRWLSVLFGAFVVLLNRRTVWVTVIVGLLVLLLRSGRVRRRLTGPLTAAAAIAFGGFLVLSAQAGLLSGDTELAASATDTGTLEGRAEGWQDLLRERGPEGLDWVIGQPLGTGFTQEIQDLRYSQNPHNYYVQTLTRVGVVGLACLVATLLWAAKVQRRVPPSRLLLSGPTLFVLAVMQIVFFAVWQAKMEQGMLLGLLCAAVRLSAPARVGRAKERLSSPSPITLGAR